MRFHARANDMRRNFNAQDGAAAEAAEALGEMPEWNLADLYPSPTAPEIARDLKPPPTRRAASRRPITASSSGWRSDGAALALAIEEFERFVELMGRLGSYAGLYYAGNQADPERAKFYGDISEKLTAISTEIIFFDLELNQIDEAVMAKALKNKRLARYKPWIDNIRKEKPYQLEEKIERLFHEKGQTSGGAFNRLFNETIAALRFPVAGEPEPLPLELTLNLLSNPDEKKRGAAAEALAKVFKDNVRLFTLITNTLAKDKEISDRWRGFKDVADSRHLANQVEAEVVDALVSSVRAAYPRLSHRYYAMKAKWLGKERLSHWDRNAPLPERPERTFAWNDAQRLVLGAYHDFAPEMSAVAEEFFDKRWIDAPARPGKAPGAFAAATVPSVHPYVLLNYLGKPRDVMTLAHELGHGVHQMLARPQGALLAPTPLTLAETASVFGEMLTFKALLKETHEPQRAQGAHRRQGRGHAQHGGAPGRLLHVRAQAARGAPPGRADARPARRHLARDAVRKPRAGHRAQARL